MRRFAPDDVLDMLERAYAADPSSKQAAALYEGMLGELGKIEDLEKVQERLLSQVDDKKTRARMALTFGTRWVSRSRSTR